MWSARVATVLICGLWVAVAPARLLAQDPGTPGPLAVTVQEYNFGDTAFTPAGFPGPVEVRASVHRPTNLALGPFPLILLLHGRHATCQAAGSAFLEWPCSAGRTTIPSYQGYDYLGTLLASHGYIVVSISANGINARDNSVFDLGAQARAELMQHHLDRWQTFSTTGGAPFGSTFVGRVDLGNVGTMGHSRGGEGVMRHFLHNQALGSPYGVRAVFPLAPVDFNRPVVNGVPFGVLLPYCDGDVSDLQGVHYYDDARYSAAGDLAPKHTFYVLGANHNFFNTVWTPGSGHAGTADDWTAFVTGGSTDPHCGTGPGNGRLSASQQRSAGAAYMAGFLRRYLGAETSFDAFMRGDAPPPPSASTGQIYPSYHAPDSATERRDVNRLLVSGHLSTNHLGGAVSQSGFTPYDLCGGPSPQPQHCLPTQSTSRQPHTTPSARSSAPGMSQLRGGWTAASAFWRNDLPSGSRNVSGFRALQFRASVNFDDARNPIGSPQDFTVRLTDGTGATASAAVSSHSPALFYPPGSVSRVPKVLLNAVRIPLTAFGGINLSDVRSVEFRFNQTSSGALLITDLAFVDAGIAGPLADLVQTAVSNPPATVVQGGTFSVADTVENQGAAGASSSSTRFYLSIDTAKSAGDQLLTPARPVPALAAGAASNGTTTVTVPASTPTGSYFVLACADDLGVVPESHEGNNCRASATTVQVQTAPSGSADLAVSGVTAPAGAVVGVSFSVTDTTANQGGGSAPATKTRYYLSKDTVKGKGDKRLTGERSVPILGPGASSSGSATVLIKAGTPGGAYFLLACADDTAKVAESDETDNCLSSTSQMTLTGPDLVTTAVSNPPATVVAGSSFSVTDTVANQGNAGAGASTTRYYLSINTKKGSTDPRLTGTRSVPAMAAGAAPSTGTVTVTVPAGTAPATYFLLACADDQTSVAETNEKNNCRASTGQVTVP
jgi:hypothetical protein